jgi:hypothetical protein
MLEFVVTIVIALAFVGTLVVGSYSLMVLGDPAARGRRVATLFPPWLSIAGLHLMWMSMARLQHLVGVAVPDLHERGVGVLAASAVVLVGPWILVLAVLTLIWGPSSNRLAVPLVALAGFLAVRVMDWRPGVDGAGLAIAISAGLTIFAVVTAVHAWRVRTSTP